MRLDALGNPLRRGEDVGYDFGVEDDDEDDVSDSGYDVLGGVAHSRSRSRRRRRRRSLSGRLSVPSGTTIGGAGGGGGTAGFRSSIVTVESLVSNNGNRHQITETDLGLWKSDSMSAHDSES